jgi:hypothetical protein
MSRRGRPRSDRLDLVERIVDALLAEPELAAHPGLLRERVEAREADVRRALRCLRKISGVQLPEAKRGRRKKGGPYSREGISEGEPT